MSGRKHTARGQGLRPCLKAYYERNPTELLTAEDVAQKFGVGVRYARNTLSILRAEGVVSRLTVYCISEAT